MKDGRGGGRLWNGQQRVPIRSKSDYGWRFFYYLPPITALVQGFLETLELEKHYELRIIKAVSQLYYYVSPKIIQQLLLLQDLANERAWAIIL